MTGLRPPGWDDATWLWWKISVLKIVLLVLIVIISIALAVLA